MSAATASSAEGVRWDLTSLFSGVNDPKIDATWKVSHDRADAFAERYRGKVAGLSAQDLAEALSEFESLGQEAGKPLTYAHLMFAADTSDPNLGAFMQEQTEKSSELRVKLLFFDLELQDVAQETVDGWLADPKLENFRHHIGVVRTYSPHKLSEIEERLLEETANTGTRAWVRLHDELTGNHTFPYAEPGQKETERKPLEEVLTKLRDPNRKIRIAAADALSAGLKEIQRPIVFAYNTLLADKKLGDRLRNHPNAEHSRHLANELSQDTVDVVMELCQERADLVARYYNIKRQAMGLQELTHVDRYAPLFATEAPTTWPEAKTLTLEAFGAFHPKLAEAAREGFDNAWVDAEPRAGKTSGAFCMPGTPDGHPVVLMNFLDKIDDAMTLAHEMGHLVHSSLSRKQTYFNMTGSLPLAELASIFGEMLVFERLTADVEPQDELALLANKLEGIFASVHRQAAMFRFERRCHDIRRSEGELSPERFGDLWQEEMQSMFGVSVKLGEQHRDWWLYVGHFFFAPFYVYAYSFGELLTLALYEKARTAGPEFADKYVEVLSLGGAQTPAELMSHLDVDLTSRGFWLNGFFAIDRMLGRFEELWKQENV